MKSDDKILLKKRHFNNKSNKKLSKNKQVYQQKDKKNKFTSKYKQVYEIYRNFSFDINNKSNKLNLNNESKICSEFFSILSKIKSQQNSYLLSKPSEHTSSKNLSESQINIRNTREHNTSKTQKKEKNPIANLTDFSKTNTDNDKIDFYNIRNNKISSTVKKLLSPVKNRNQTSLNLNTKKSSISEILNIKSPLKSAKDDIVVDLKTNKKIIDQILFNVDEDDFKNEVDNLNDYYKSFLSRKINKKLSTNIYKDLI